MIRIHTAKLLLFKTNRIRFSQQCHPSKKLITASAAYFQTDLGPLKLVNPAQNLSNHDVNTEQSNAQMFERGEISYLKTTWSTRQSKAPSLEEAVLIF